MEVFGFFNVEDLIYFFILYIIFILRINKVLEDFFEVFNNYVVSIEGNWILY